MSASFSRPLLHLVSILLRSLSLERRVRVVAAVRRDCWLPTDSRVACVCCVDFRRVTNLTIWTVQSVTNRSCLTFYTWTWPRFSFYTTIRFIGRHMQRFALRRCVIVFRTSRLRTASGRRTVRTYISATSWRGFWQTVWAFGFWLTFGFANNSESFELQLKFIFDLIDANSKFFLFHFLLL